MNKLLKGWECKKVGEICEVKKGTSITKQKITHGTIPVIAGGQQPAYYHNAPNRTGKTITISASGAYAGFLNYFEIPIFASDCITIQSSDENKILTKYVYLMLKSQQKRIYRLQIGAGQPHVYAKDLVKIEIPMHPIPVQKKIVSILEKSERLKQRRRKANEETNKIIQSVFYEMFEEFDYKTVKLKEVSSLITKGATPTTYGYNYTPKGIPFLRVENIMGGTINYGPSLKFISKDTHNFLKRSQLKKNDVLLTIAGAIGRTAVFDKNEDTNINQAIAIIRLKDYVNPVYISNVLVTGYIQNQTSKMIVQVAQANLSLSQVGDLSIPLPPILLQNKFAEQVQKIERIKQHQKQSEQDINTLFDALMQKAFNGELTR